MSEPSVEWGKKLVATVETVQGDVAIVRTDLSGLGANVQSLEHTVANLEHEVHGFRIDFERFREKVDTLIALAKWLGGIAVTLVIALVGTAISLSWSASKLHSDVERHERAIAPLTDPEKPLVSRISSLERTSERTADKVEELNRLFVKITEQVGEMKKR